MKHTILIIACILSISLLKGQDFHFSQFEMAPLFLNPAKTGLIDGNHRTNIKLRDQWNSILGAHAYKTAALSYDFQVCIGSSGHFFGFGLTGLYDQVGSHAFKTYSGNANLSYHHKLSRFSHFAIGIQAGVVSYALGDSDFMFDEQYGALGFDPNADSFEHFERLETNFMPDISPGLLFYNTEHNIQIGLAAFHVNQPLYSFLELEQEDGSRLHTRFVFHSSVPLRSNRNSEITFKHIAMAQKLNPSVLYWQFTPSIHWKHQLGNITSNHLSFGLGSRLSRNLSSQKPIVDALIISSKINLHPLSLGLSYDVNVSPLAQVSLLRSGPEISLTYIFDDEPGCVVCHGF